MLRLFIQKRFNKWLKRRLPATQKITLNSGNTFIFPSRTGFHFLITVFILFLLGTNYQNNLILFMVFFFSSFMVTCLLLSYQNIAGLTLIALDPKGQFAGQDCQFQLRLIKTAHQAIDVNYAFQHSASALQSMVQDDLILLYHHATQRGYFNPERVTISSTFPFGLFNVWTHIDFDFRVLLYPEPIKNNQPAEQSSNNTQNQHRQQFASGVDQFSTLKSYQKGESLKSVAWKQLAQGKGWLSKQFEQTTGGEHVLDINFLQHLALEKRLSFLCYQILKLEKDGQHYGLVLNGQKINAGNGQAHQYKCLQALALYQLASK